MVEDEPAASDLLVTIMEGADYRISTVADRAAALGAEIDSPPDLVPTDPALSGIEAGEVGRLPGV